MFFGGGSYEKIMLTIPNDEKCKLTQHLGKHEVSNAVYLRCCSLLIVSFRSCLPVGTGVHFRKPATMHGLQTTFSAF